MRSDVKTLIAALTSERNAIDRAITSLKSIGGVEEAPRVTAPVARVKRATGRSHNRTPWPLDIKRAVVSRMQQAYEQREVMAQVAGELSRRFGIPLPTITTNWRTWSITVATHDATAAVMPSNGNAEQTPELVGALQ